MSKQPYGPETSEFHREFTAHTGLLLRRRLLWFIAIWGGLNLLGSLPVWAAIADTISGLGLYPDTFPFTAWKKSANWPFAAANLVWASGYGAALALTLRPRVPRAHTLITSLALITLDGLYGVTLRASGAASGLPSGLLFFAISHFVASLVFPWSARQAMIPAAIVLSINTISRLAIESGDMTGHLFAVLFSPLLAVPGCLVAWGRHSRLHGQYRLTFVQKRYGTLRQELAYARAIHETMFPTPRTGGDICFTYTYEPMRQIGGDYLFACCPPSKDGRKQPLSVVLLDVTGHGIPAALTVNRLHGEIELLFADNPEADPGYVLARLNRYVHLTLARHSIYVTAMCLRADPERDLLEYASGGHPPAFLRAADGTVDDLNSTSFVLGACADSDFDPAPRTVGFTPGDSLIAYTDGATEARTGTGQMLRIEGMRRLLAAPGRIEPGNWPRKLLEAVTDHRDGLPPEDDTLLVEIYRPIRNPA